MTQEELDALMSEDMDSAVETSAPKEPQPSGETYDEKDFRVNTGSTWPPPPPSPEHRVVHQLDDVAREGEEKTGQVFDILESIGSDASESEEIVTKIDEQLAQIIDTFERLHTHFPQIETFGSRIKTCSAIKTYNEQLIQISQKTNDQIMVAMDVMQFQDIHRQKIERVINVMRALSRYMNSLFETKVADEKRVSSAVHIVGDATDDVVDEEDIEALIAAFGGKK
ncbi:chemotaxis protein [Campylobacterota bacterium]|nr:chemotaxis protein [Campylobacterota bacterium]